MRLVKLWLLGNDNNYSRKFCHHRFLFNTWNTEGEGQKSKNSVKKKIVIYLMKLLHCISISAQKAEKINLLTKIRHFYAFLNVRIYANKNPSWTCHALSSAPPPLPHPSRSVNIPVIFQPLNRLEPNFFR